MKSGAFTLSAARIRAAGADLAGLFYRPSGRARPIAVVLSHGYTASKESMDLLAGYLAGRGWPCLTFDFRGHKLGASSGAMLAASDAVADVTAAATAALRETGAGACALIGHSLGALASMAAGAAIDDVVGVVAIAADGEPLGGFDGPAGKALMAQRADYVVGAPAAALLADASKLADASSRLEHKPTLFVAARGDVLVKSAAVEALARRTGPRAEFVEVDSRHVDAPSRARVVVADWLTRVSGE